MGQAAEGTAHRQSYHPDDDDDDEPEHREDEDKLYVIQVPVTLGANLPIQSI